MGGQLIKAKIGKEDLQLQTDELYPTTFERASSAGGNVTITKVPDIWKTHSSVRNARYHNSGALTDATITAAISDIGGNSRSLFLEPRTWVISNNLTIPSTIHLIFDHGAILQIATGKTVTINGPLTAPTAQIFDCVGTGAVSFGTGYVEEVYAEWWGIDGIADQTEINKAITAIGRIPVKLLPRIYTINGLILCDNGTRLYGSGWSYDASYGTKIQLANNSNCDMIQNSDQTNGNIDIEIRNLCLAGNSANQTSGNGIYLSGSSSPTKYVLIENCYFNQIKNRGIYFTSSVQSSRIYNNHMMNIGGSCVELASGADNYVIGNWLTNDGGSGNGIYLNDSDNSFVQFNETYLCEGFGIWAKSTRECNISFNWSHANQKSGIHVGDGSNHNVVIGNICYNNGKDTNALTQYRNGISLTVSDDNVVVGNKCYDRQGSKTQLYGIYEESTSERNEIAHNKLTGNATDAFYIKGSWLTNNSNFSTSGTGEDNLASSTIWANWLGKKGGVKILAAGTITGANDTKTIKLYFGTSSKTIISAAAGDETKWEIEAEIFNTATNAQRIRWRGQESDGTLTSGYEAVSVDTTANVTLKLTGECANASDTITQTMWIVERI